MNKKNYFLLLIINLLLLGSISLMSSCKSLKKQKCKECPEFTEQQTPLQKELTTTSASILKADALNN